MGSLVFFLLLSLLILIVVFLPFFSGPLQPYVINEHLMPDFSDQSALLVALKELEEDFQLGRISEGDHQEFRLFLQRRYLSLRSQSKV